jgi:hypothetical protein
MNSFKPIDANVKFAPLFYYKSHNNKPYENMLTIYDDESYGQMDRASFCCMLSLCWLTLIGVTKQ